MVDKNIFFISKSFQDFSDNLFLIDGDIFLSYGKFNELVINKIKSYPFLLSNKKKLISLKCNNSIETITAIFSIMLSGNIPVLISNKEPDNAVDKILDSINCTKKFDKLSIDKIEDNINLPDLFLPNNASVLFTSGSSSMPKAVLHTFANHYYSALGSNNNIELNQNDRWLLSLPLNHVSGLSILFRTMLSGATVVINDSKMEINEIANKQNITHLSLVEMQLKELLNSYNTLNSIKSVLVGGSTLNQKLVNQAFDKQIPIRTTYGSTEMSSQITTTDAIVPLDKLKSSGKVLAYGEIKISSDNEILVKGKTLCSKYLNADILVDDKGWFHTSDIGEIDSDGYLFVKGRKDNMYISGGENIYPEEIESYISNSNLIITAIIIPKKDNKYGYVPVLFYKTINNEELEVEYVSQFLKDKLPKFKIPKEIYILPKTYKPLGIKPNRQFLKKWIDANH